MCAWGASVVRIRASAARARSAARREVHAYYTAVCRRHNEISGSLSVGRPTLVIERNPNCPNGPFLGALGAPEAAVFASQHFQLPIPGRFGVTGPAVSRLACAWRVACGHMSREFKSNSHSSPGQQNAAQTGGTAVQLTCRGMGLTIERNKKIYTRSHP